jgi:hypothetical protein
MLSESAFSRFSVCLLQYIYATSSDSGFHFLQLVCFPVVHVSSLLVSVAQSHDGISSLSFTRTCCCKTAPGWFSAGDASHQTQLIYIYNVHPERAHAERIDMMLRLLFAFPSLSPPTDPRNALYSRVHHCCRLPMSPGIFAKRRIFAGNRTPASAIIIIMSGETWRSCRNPKNYPAG